MYFSAQVRVKLSKCFIHVVTSYQGILKCMWNICAAGDTNCKNLSDDVYVCLCEEKGSLNCSSKFMISYKLMIHIKLATSECTLSVAG